MNYRFFVVIIFIFSVFCGFSQNKPEVPEDAQTMKFVHSGPSELLKVELTGIAGTDSIQRPWIRQISTFSNVTKHKVPDPELMARLKNEINQTKFNTQNQVLKTEKAEESNLIKPKIGANFSANETTVGTPPDNTIAISNNGMIVSAINSNIQYYTTGGTKLYDQSFYDFLTANNAPDMSSLNGKLYDPYLIYDQHSDRFVFVLLHGVRSTTSKILVCFSKTNNPQNGWYVYAIASKSYYVGKWIDFPRAAVSSSELFITGNVFTDDANIFSHSVVFQITKSDGYQGKTLNMKRWDDVKDARGKNAFTLVPVPSGHSAPYGPGIYMVSTINSGSDSVFLYNISNTIANNPTLTSYVLIMTAYKLPGDAMQKGTNNVLDNNDCRVLSAFYLNNVIHFVFHSKYNWMGYNGINYVQLNVLNKTLKSNLIGISGYDYSYPSIVSAAKEGTYDQTAFIGFLMSGSNVYPQMKVIYVDATLTPTAPTLIKDGENFVNILQMDATERWGDYSGLSRKFNASTPTCWFSGSYGTFGNSYKTYIAEIKDANLGFEDNEFQQKTDISVYPNPVIDLFNVEFTLDKSTEINIRIIDSKGSTVRVLYDDFTKTGKTVLSFNKNALNPGVYFLVVSDGGDTLKTIKIVL